MYIFEAIFYTTRRVFYRYDWKATGKNQCHPNIEYVPMIWGLGSMNSITSIHGEKYLLGFNEPNFHAQSNIMPETAAEKWMEIQKKVPSSVKLVSPAAAPCNPKTGQCSMQYNEWFSRFFAKCKQLGCRIDYVATHSYTCNANSLMGFLTAVHNQVQKPIWLTEFACPNTNNNVAPIMSFMRAAVPMLEKSSFIFRYAWFESRLSHAQGHFLGTSTSILDNSGKLTHLGQLYLSL
ncbi:alkali-sensitive linkage protein 1-like [Lingula anatina]|uniref:Alkali-sensitive linkage protein 1-like n=1 Tax=Lingula anatina TaxID=7574 RepID=A0A1S3H8I2_LINAN|nr:alkali-sensitive linkage protein 1-like [Lingula anatina]|eukprot:XP_013382292.1 alkali-sensitive linkage protein 1-like [Lingula anatina]